MPSEEDLDVKIGTKDEAMWTTVKEEAEQLIESHTISLKIQKAMLKLAETKIKEEKAKI